MTRAIATLLLALSILPIAVIALPRVVSEHDDFQARYVDRAPFAVPAVHAGDLARPIGHPDGVPVLVYHGIGDSAGSVSRERFAAHMDALAAAGYEAISARDYARFARGEDIVMPARPVLITFDDGRLDSFRGADAVLERHGFRATMFVITGRTAAGSPYYLSAEELEEMRESGRWDLQPHADRAHRQVRGRSLFASRLAGESLVQWRRRVRADVEAAIAGVRELGGGDELFAIPFSDYAQDRDPQLARELVRMLEGRFDAVFVQRDDAPFAVRGQGGLVARFEPRPDATADDLLAWLREGAHEIRKEA